jgi:hypothetical protein
MLTHPKTTATPFLLDTTAFRFTQQARAEPGHDAGEACLSEAPRDTGSCHKTAAHLRTIPRPRLLPFLAPDFGFQNSSHPYASVSAC